AVEGGEGGGDVAVVHGPHDGARPLPAVPVGQQPHQFHRRGVCGREHAVAGPGAFERRQHAGGLVVAHLLHRDTRAAGDVDRAEPAHTGHPRALRGVETSRPEAGAMSGATLPWWFNETLEGWTLPTAMT